MGYVQAVVQLLQIIGLILNWWKEKTDEKKKAKAEVIKESFNATTQEDMRRLLNKFNSI